MARGAAVSAFVKCINVNTMEIRLLKLNRAVERMLIRGKVHWARRKTGEQEQTSDTLLVEHDDTWAELLPYFDHSAEKNGRKHGAKWSKAG